MGKIIRKLTFMCLNCGHYSEHAYTPIKKQTRAYSIYYAMRARCLNKKQPGYRHYGKRGIKICKRWLKSFDNFYADMGNPPSKYHSLERINNDGNYSPNNCRWANSYEQARNSRQNVYLTYNGKRKTINEWAHETGIDRRTLKVRVNLGWSVKKILNTPPKVGRNQFGTDGVQYTFNGKTQSLNDWSKETGISLHALRARINKYNWSLKRAFTTPSK